MDVAASLTLMLDFSCGIKGVQTIDLTKDVVEMHYPLLKGNIADDPEDDIEVPTTTPGSLNHHQTFCGESFQNAAPPHMDSDPALGTSSASALGIIPTTSLDTDKQQFSPQSIGRLKALMLKENRTQTLIKVGASQDEASYDGNISDAEEDDIKVVPDEVDDIQISKPAPGRQGSSKSYQQGGWWPNLKVCGQGTSSTQQQGLIWNLRWSSLLQPGCPH